MKMKNNTPAQTLKTMLMLFVVGTALSACAAMERTAALDTENMLSASGFRMKPADTVLKSEHIDSMQQRILLSHVQDDSVYYAYADAEYCNCIYVGSERNFQEYQRLSIEQNTAEMNQQAAMNWGPWGGWNNGMGPWY